MSVDGKEPKPAKKLVKKKRASKKKTASGDAAKKKSARRKTATSRKKKPAEPQLPPKSLVLTDKDGQFAAVLPKHALVMVKQGIIFDEHGTAQGVDPRAAQKAFTWLIGRGGGQGLDPTTQHQRQALRVAEQLVRATVVADGPGLELIARLYAELIRVAPQWQLPDPSEAPTPTEQAPAPAPPPPADEGAEGSQT